MSQMTMVMAWSGRKRSGADLPFHALHGSKGGGIDTATYPTESSRGSEWGRQGSWGLMLFTPEIPEYYSLRVGLSLDVCMVRV